MSFVFDTAERAWAELEKHVPAEDHELAMRFGILLREFHDANHRLKDAVNHDPRVTKLAGALEKHLHERANKKGGGG